MSKFILLVSCLVAVTFCRAQTSKIDSLKQLLIIEKNDTSRVLHLNKLSGAYYYSKPDTALILAQQAFLLAKKAEYTYGIIRSLITLGSVLRLTGNYPRALQLDLEALKMAEATGNINYIGEVLPSIGHDYSIVGDYGQTISYQLKALAINERKNNQRGILFNFIGLGDSYEKLNQLDSAKYYTDSAYALAIKLSDAYNAAFVLNNFGNIYAKMGQDSLAFYNYRQSIIIYKQEEDEDGLSEAYLGMAKLFQRQSNTDSCLYYAKLSLASAQKIGFTSRIMDASNFLTAYYAKLHNIDSAFVYQSAAITAKDSLFNQEKQRAIQSISFEEKMRQQQIEEAEESAQTRLQFNALFGGIATLLIIAFLLWRNNRQRTKANAILKRQKEEIDRKAQELSLQKENLQQSYNNVETLGEIGRKITSSLSVETIISTVYHHVNALMDASVFGIGIYNKALHRIDFPATYEEGQALPFYASSLDDQNRFAVICFKERKEIIMGHLAEDHKRYLQEVPTPLEGMLPVSLIYLPLVVKENILGVITVQSFQQNAYSDYHLFMLRNIAIYTAIALDNAESFETLNHTLGSLKAAQAQLVQSEKMASLGELTAGIAHEIQNPLNFVNNFSEISKELLDEMRAALKNGDNEEAENLVYDVIRNLDKINYHGRRADAIVKGMLQHSRKSTGQKEPTDLNALCGEYLRLSYHGLRARDKAFNADFTTDFDETIGKVSIVPQEIGRVLLNLFNNAFYAVNEKKKIAGENYLPAISLSTKQINGKVEIKVADNGNGIPSAIMDKIFQPFFTTKPSGQGTGLGLSLSYEIVKMHGGKIHVNTKQGEGTEFLIHLNGNDHASS